MRKLTPQEKKAFSYAKDCRNTYGENDKSSRKNISLRKAKVSRGYRRRINQILQEVSRGFALENAEFAESEARNVKREYWKKCADEPLGKVVERKLERRKKHAGNGKTARKKVREFVRKLKIEIEQETDGRWIAEALEMNGVLSYGATRDEAVVNCKRLAGFVFLEKLGAAGMISVNENSISVFIY